MKARFSPLSSMKTHRSPGVRFSPKLPRTPRKQQGCAKHQRKILKLEVSFSRSSKERLQAIFATAKSIPLTPHDREVLEVSEPSTPWARRVKLRSALSSRATRYPKAALQELFWSPWERGRAALPTCRRTWLKLSQTLPAASSLSPTARNCSLGVLERRHGCLTR